MSEIRNYLVANPIELSHTGMNNNPFDSIIFWFYDSLKILVYKQISRYNNFRNRNKLIDKIVKSFLTMKRQERES